MEANTKAVENLGMAMHTLQDVQAHKGAIFRSTAKNLFGYFSWDGNTHDLDNDMHPNEFDFKRASFATESAIIVHQALNGVYKGIKNGQRIYTEGMTTEQLGQLNQALQKGGYELIDIERTDVSKIQKKGKR
ncbi:hypothetical protein V3468_14745 [Flavobacterium oreochromis]